MDFVETGCLSTAMAQRLRECINAARCSTIASMILKSGAFQETAYDDTLTCYFVCGLTMLFFRISIGLLQSYLGHVVFSGGTQRDQDASVQCQTLD